MVVSSQPEAGQRAKCKHHARPAWQRVSKVSDANINVFSIQCTSILSKNLRIREVLLSSFLKETLRFNILKNEVKRFFVCFCEKTFRQGNRDRAQSDSVQQSLSAFFLLFKVKKAHPALFPPIQKMCTPARRRREHKVILPPPV